MPKLLLVRNDLNGATELAQTLGEAGHTVLIESDARSALHTMEHDWVDALICDAVLPDLVAPSLVNAARINLGRPHLPVIVLTDAPRKLVESGLEGMERVIVISEPVDANRVGNEITRLRIVEAGRERRLSKVAVGLSRRWNDPRKGDE